MNDRLSWDDVWMATASVVARRSLCVRAKVGAVVVTTDNRVMAASYNGPPPTYRHLETPCDQWCPRGSGKSMTTDYTDCPASHAEQNAIARSDWSQLNGATMYVTGAVCMGCAKLILQTGISRVVQIVLPSDDHRGPADVERFLRQGVTVERYGE